MNLKKIWEMILRKGIIIGHSTGKTFDPRGQKRTDPLKDMIEADKKRREKNGTHEHLGKI